MALTARAGWDERQGGQLVSLPAANSEVIYDGALVDIDIGGGNDGRVVNHSDLTADTNFFLGVARVTAETGSTAATGEAVTGDSGGTVLVNVDIHGACFRGASVTGATAITHTGDLVYASDENTLTVTATGGGNPVGYVARWISSGVADVQLFSAGQIRAYRQA